MTAGFTFYQWSTGEQESRIAAAVEISRNFAEHPSSDQVVAAVLSAYRGSDLPVADAAEVGGLAGQLEYVASLSNRGRLDKDYLSDGPKCSIVITQVAMRNIQSRNAYMKAVRYNEMGKFAQETNCCAKDALDAVIGKPR